MTMTAITPAPNPEISVIIPVHNGAETLVEQLDAIAQSSLDTPSFEILVVDNRSTDGSARVANEWAQRQTVDLRVIDAHERSGEPHARNVGVGAARGDLVAFCDADDRVGPNWLAGLHEGLQHASYATGPIDVFTLNPEWIANVRGTSVTGLSMLFDKIPFAHGCNMGFRRDQLIKLGGFDERYTGGCDLDIAIRMWEAGHELQYVDDAVIEYRLRPSLSATFRQGVFYGKYRTPIRLRMAERGLTGRHDPRDLRRALWLIRKAPRAVVARQTRARWVWVAAQLLGGLLGRWDTNLIAGEPSHGRTNQDQGEMDQGACGDRQ